MEKSYVTMEQYRCVVCGKDFDTGALVLDRRFRKTFERHTVTGWGRCDQHSDPAFIYLVGCKSMPPHGDRMQPDGADRSGEIAAIKREAFERVFNVPVPERGVAFVEQAVIERLRNMTNQPTEGDAP